MFEGLKRTRRWERKEVHQVSRAWVEENCKHITERDLELAHILLKRKLMRRDQIEFLHAGFRNLANPQVQLNRRLRALFDCHVIDRAFPATEPGTGSSQAIVALDRAGALLLGVPFKRVIKHNRSERGYVTRVLPADYRHTLGIHDFEVSLLQHCLATGAEILRWRIDFENARRFTYNGERMIRPDGFGIVRLPSKKGSAFFLEYDTGSEDYRCQQRFKRITEKFQQYADYRASGAWMNEDWAKLLREFPPLLFITEDHKRITLLREIASALPFKVYISHSSKRFDFISQFLSI